MFGFDCGDTEPDAGRGAVSAPRQILTDSVSCQGVNLVTLSGHL